MSSVKYYIITAAVAYLWSDSVLSTGRVCVYICLERKRARLVFLEEVFSGKLPAVFRYPAQHSGEWVMKDWRREHHAHYLYIYICIHCLQVCVSQVSSRMSLPPCFGCVRLGWNPIDKDVFLDEFNLCNFWMIYWQVHAIRTSKDEFMSWMLRKMIPLKFSLQPWVNLRASLLRNPPWARRSLHRLVTWPNVGNDVVVFLVTKSAVNCHKCHNPRVRCSSTNVPMWWNGT